MPGIPPEIEVYPVHPLPILKAYADQLGLVSLINHYVPTEMNVDAGTVVLGLVFDTLSGRSLLYRLEECFAHQDTERPLKHGTSTIGTPVGPTLQLRAPWPQTTVRA
jgi:hypothetical protein